MPKVEKGVLRVPAIKNGSVIDHIPVEHMAKVVKILGLFELEYTITIGHNFRSSKLGRKGIIKVEEKHFTKDEVDTLAIVSPDVVISTIENYEVVQKLRVSLPSNIEGLIHCPNSKCITNNEPMKSHFTVVDAEQGVMQCKYCSRKVERTEVELAVEVASK